MIRFFKKLTVKKISKINGQNFFKKLIVKKFQKLTVKEISKINSQKNLKSNGQSISKIRITERAFIIIITVMITIVRCFYDG